MAKPSSKVPDASDAVTDDAVSDDAAVPTSAGVGSSDVEIARDASEASTSDASDAPAAPAAPPAPPAPPAPAEDAAAAVDSAPAADTAAEADTVAPSAPDAASATPAADTAAPSYAALIEWLALRAARTGCGADVKISVLAVDADGRGGGIIQYNAENLQEARTAAGAALHSDDGRGWRYLGNGPDLETGRYNAFLHCSSLAQRDELAPATASAETAGA